MEGKGGGGSSLTRRRFLGGTGLLGYALISQGSILSEAMAEEPSAQIPRITVPKAKVGLIFTHIPPQYPTWPHVGYDYEGRKKELEAKLRDACPNTDFSVGTAHNAQQAQDLLKQMGDVDGFIVYIIGIWTGAPNVIVHSGKPVVLVDDLFAGCGEFIGVYAGAMREKLPVVGVSSSDFKDVARASRLFEVMKGIRNAKIVDITDGDISGAAAQIKKAVGIEVIGMGLSELHSRYEKADEKEAERWADRWIKEAKKVVEPSRDEIIRSGKMHLALTSIMSEKGAEAITIDCLGGFYSGKLKAYPCLSYRQLNDDGFVGACEADLSSTIAMIMIRHLAGRPGMISDPVFDFSKSWIIYAHCVGPTKVFGPGGRRNDFIIRSHAEDRKGASIQSLMPVGEDVTTIETNPWEKAIVVHTGRAVANVEEEKACRTKLAAEARIDKILANWRWGWHRVTFYGDWRRDVKNLGTLMGFQVYEEDV
jgi:hypothetical protein